MHTDAHANRYPDCDGDRNCDIYGYGKSHTERAAIYTDADSYGYGDGNTDRDGDSNSYTYFDTETFTDAESCTNPQAACHAATAPVSCL
jgi:hypothetical protein